VHDALFVQLSDSQDDLGCVELDVLFRESFLGLKDFVKLPTSDEWHHEVQAGFALEQIVHSHKEWVVCFKHDVFLEHGRLYLIILD